MPLAGRHASAPSSTLKLDKTAGEIPVDSTLAIRPRSALGLKYVELTRGQSKQTFEDGDTLPRRADRASPSSSTSSTRSSTSRRARPRSENLRASATRSPAAARDSTRTIAALPRLLEHLEPVTRTLADADTDLRGFFKELGDAARVVAPVADRYARPFTPRPTRSRRRRATPRRCKATIAKSRADAGRGIAARFRVQRPFLPTSRRFSRGPRGATRAARRAAAVNRALETGIAGPAPPLELNEEPRGHARRAARPRARRRRPTPRCAALTATVDDAQPELRFLGPYVTVCNYWNYFWTYVAEHLSEPDPTGSAQRALLNQRRPPGRHAVGSIGANEPANGEAVVERHASSTCHGNAYGARDQARRAAPTARPASAATSSATPTRLRQDDVQDRQSTPHTPGQARARRSRGRDRACPRARPSPASPRRGADASRRRPRGGER